MAERRNEVSSESACEGPQQGIRNSKLLNNLGLPTCHKRHARQPAGSVVNRFAAILPLLSSITGKEKKKAELKPQQLIIKGLPTLPVKLVERAHNLEFVEMEEFLPSPRSLRLVEQAKPNPSLQEALVGALSQFQASQQQKSRRRVLDI